MIFLNFLQFFLILGVVTYLATNLVHLVRVQVAKGGLSFMPLVSVCVPARNEERDIENCLRSLLSQDYPNFEIIVVDDGSTDNTSLILEKLKTEFPELIVISSGPLPTDWYGKPYALHQASQIAKGEILLFTDADPVFEKEALISAVYMMNSNQLGLLSLMPRAEFKSFWEKAVQPLIFAFIAGLTRFKNVNNSNHPSAMGVGAFLMIRKGVYQNIGGHEILKQAILEDIGLAKLAKQYGAKTMIADAKNIYSIRMYHSLGEIWEGWRKNIFLALKKSVLKTLYYVFLILGFLVTPWILLFYNIVVGASLWLIFLSGIGVFLLIMAELSLCHELGLEKHNLLWFPLGAIVMCGIFMNSMFYILIRRESQWRGRIYRNPIK